MGKSSPQSQQTRDPKAAAIRATEDAAAAGKPWAVKMLCSGALDRLDPDREQLEQLAPHVAAAMIAAALHAMAIGPAAVDAWLPTLKTPHTP